MVLDRERGVYAEPSRIRQVNHKGKYFEVPGPHICQPSRQRTPLILQAGTSKAGKTFASQHAEAIFVGGHSPVVVAKNIAEIRDMAQTQYGRDPQSIKFLALLCPIVGRTEDEAHEKFRYYRSLGSIDGALALFGGWTGIDLDQYGEDQELRHVESNAIRSAVEGWSKATPEVPKWTKKTVGEHITVGGLGATAVGTPQQVADIMERWVNEADVDGFNIVSLYPFSICENGTDQSRPTPSNPVPSKTSSTCCSRSCVVVASSGTTMLCLEARTARTSTARLASPDRARTIRRRSTGGMRASRIIRSRITRLGV